MLKKVKPKRFSAKQTCLFYGSKLLIYSMLILLFSHHSSQLTEQINKDSITESSKYESVTVSSDGNTTLQNDETSKEATKSSSEDKFCVKAAIEQFPRLPIGPTARKYGAIIIHIAICIYSFLGLALTCDKYFVSSLDRICEEMKLSADVAGATFMAAGSSAPELATVIIGVFLAQDDIGVSGVIGSAVFNILFVIAVCGLFASSALYLSWWPLCRDCFFYTLSVLIMLLAIANESVNWFESILLLLAYAVYCVALYHNEFLELWVSQYPPFNTLTKQTNANSADPHSHLEDHKTPGYASAESADYQIDSENVEDIPRPQDGSINASERHVTYYKPKEPHTSEVDPLARPMNADQFGLYRWYVTYPIHYLTQATTPDCQKEQYRNWYGLTFFMSMVWISFYSYIMVWMITIIGFTFGIPDTVMGLTFVAAGVSVPDALSSLAVVKEG